jgi:hypothetical protein
MEPSPMHRNFPLLLALACLSACKPDTAPDSAQTPAAAIPAAASAEAKRIEADVRYLADDKLQGRDTGTPGYDLAAEHVARRYTEMGLKPAGDDGSFFQRVPLLKALRQEQGAVFSIERNGSKTSLKFREEFLPGLNYNSPSASLTAPAVFVGQAIHAPELQQDDFAGVELRGKIAVVFAGAPARFDNDRRAFYSSGTQKLRTLAERGAVGVVFVGTCPACVCARPMAPASTPFRNSRPAPRSARPRPSRFSLAAATKQTLCSNRSRTARSSLSICRAR